MVVKLVFSVLVWWFHFHQRPLYFISPFSSSSSSLSLPVASLRFRVEGLDEDIVEHFPITSAEEGKYQLPGQVGRSERIQSNS